MFFPRARSRSDWIESDHDLILLFEHDLFGKTGPLLFPDHALGFTLFTAPLRRNCGHITEKYGLRLDCHVLALSPPVCRRLQVTARCAK
jgi:hypothetical protein